MARPHIELGEGQWHLWRLADDEFMSLAQHALPIDQNFTLLRVLRLRALDANVDSILGRTLTVLERELGPSSSRFDSFSASFSFPVLITFERQPRVSYLLRCHDHRGDLYFPMYRIVPGDPTVAERSVSHPPVASEFSGADMDELVVELHDFILNSSRGPLSDLVAAFYRAIPSDLTLYGHDGHDFFEHSYETAAAFEHARHALDARLRLRRRRSSSNRVERFIEQVTELPERGSSFAARASEEPEL